MEELTLSKVQELINSLSVKTRAGMFMNEHTWHERGISTELIMFPDISHSSLFFLLFGLPLAHSAYLFKPATSFDLPRWSQVIRDHMSSVADEIWLCGHMKSIQSENRNASCPHFKLALWCLLTVDMIWLHCDLTKPVKPIFSMS